MTVDMKFGQRRLNLSFVLACLVALCGLVGLNDTAHAQSAEEAAKIDANLKPQQSQTVIARLSASARICPTALGRCTPATWPTAKPSARRKFLADHHSPQRCSQRCGLVPPDLHRARHAQRLRPDRLAHLVPVSRRSQWAHAGDSLLQRPPRRAGRRSRTGRPLRRAPSPVTRSRSPIKLLHTVDKKNVRGATLKIDFPESRPNPEDLRLEFLSAALLVPSLAPRNDASQYGHAERRDRRRSVSPRNRLLEAARSSQEFDASLRARTANSKPCCLCCRPRHSISPATHTLMRPGSGPGPRRSTW